MRREAASLDHERVGSSVPGLHERRGSRISLDVRLLDHFPLLGRELLKILRVERRALSVNFGQAAFMSIVRRASPGQEETTENAGDDDWRKTSHQQ